MTAKSNCSGTLWALSTKGSASLKTESNAFLKSMKMQVSDDYWVPNSLSNDEGLRFASLSSSSAETRSAQSEDTNQMSVEVDSRASD